MRDEKRKTKGKFYSYRSDKSEDVFCFPFLSGEKFSVCYRNVSCWLENKTLTEKGDMPAETVFVLSAFGGGYALYFALCDGTARCSLFGENGEVFVRAETGDPLTSLGTFRYLYCILGQDPYLCAETAYLEMREELGTFTLKKDKKIPEFTDLFGFCTYNAYYDNIGHDVIVDSVAEFHKNGITLGFIIVDAGWQKVEDMKMLSFYANEEKFPFGISATAKECKEKYGLKKFLIWHTYCGFWKGLDAYAFPEYDVRYEKFNIPERLLNSGRRVSENFNATISDDFYPMDIAYEDTGVIYGDRAEFYSDFYRALKEQGADGVKVDAVTWIEAFASGRGGRVKVMRDLLSAMQDAADRYFGGEIINCSSCSNDFFFNVNNGAVVRTSKDYMPEKDETNETHIETNAFVGFFTSPVCVPDWDMFETGNRWGSYHAAARAVSGGPIYCTDRPENANYALIRALSTADGRVPRCENAAKPTKNCLFGAPEGEPFRVFNRTRSAYVLASFAKGEKCSALLFVSEEIPEIENGRYAVYSSLRGFLGVVTAEEGIGCTLSSRQAEIFTLAPVIGGFAVIGLTDKLNPSAFIEGVERGEKSVTVTCMESGNVAIFRDKGGFCVKEGKTAEFFEDEGGHSRKGGPKAKGKAGKAFKQFFSPNNMMMYALLLPTLVYVFIFCYLPLSGLLMAFKKFNPRLGIWDSPWAEMYGFYYFHYFVTLPDFWNIMKNTLVLSVYSIAVNTVLPIVLALFMNEMRNVHYKKTVQTISYAPYFVSVMVVCGMLFSFSGEEGIINRIARIITGDAALNVKAMESASLFPHLYVISGLWQGLGWWAIIYMGTLANVDTNLHEAAIIDGAGRMKRMWHINVPTILPMATIMLILSIGNMLSVGFEKVYLMQTAGNLTASQIISTYVYRISFVTNRPNYSYATAIGLFNSVINIFLLWLANFISKKASETSLW